MAFVSKNRIVTPHTNRIGINLSLDEAIYQSLFINSTIFLAQIFINKEETTGQYMHIMESDLILMKKLNVSKLDDQDKINLEDLYEKIKNVEFPYI